MVSFVILNDRYFIKPQVEDVLLKKILQNKNLGFSYSVCTDKQTLILY